MTNQPRQTTTGASQRAEGQRREHPGSRSRSWTPLLGVLLAAAMLFVAPAATALSWPEFLVDGSNGPTINSDYFDDGYPDWANDWAGETCRTIEMSFGILADQGKPISRSLIHFYNTYCVTSFPFEEGTFDGTRGPYSSSGSWVTRAQGLEGQSGAPGDAWRSFWRVAGDYKAATEQDEQRSFIFTQYIDQVKYFSDLGDDSQAADATEPPTNNAAGNHTVTLNVEAGQDEAGPTESESSPAYVAGPASKSAYATGSASSPATETGFEGEASGSTAGATPTGSFTMNEDDGMVVASVVLIDIQKRDRPHRYQVALGPHVPGDSDN